MNESVPNPNREPAATDPSRNGPLSLRDRVKSLRLPDRPPARRSPLALLPWVLCVAFLISTIVMAMRAPGGDPSGADAVAKAEREKSLAAVGNASTLKEGDVMLENKGYIVPIHKIQVSPKVGGMVVSLRFEEGMIVEKDAVLAVLEDIEFKSDRNRSKAQVEGARNRYQELAMSLEFQIKQAEADLEDAKAQFQNEYVQLQSEINSKEGTAVVDVQKRKATVEAKKARVSWHTNQVDMINKGSLAHKVAAAKGDLELYEAELMKAQWKLDNCVVRAPVTGMILTKQAEEGSLVNPSAFSNGLSASLCDMADLAELEVDLAIPERDVERVIKFRLEKRYAQLCQVRADAFPKKVFEGYVSRIMPTADQSKAAVPVRVKIVIKPEEAGLFLRPQMNAAVTFLNAESTFPVATPVFDHQLLPGAGKAKKK
ncbi:MAG TPA: efflux RND transporter periplasmic adaptor subunit [Gemmataceae bacterium]|nr:efflux RND transporter periplasmic adaptor subunit [Gemmataceae bacterium]